MAHTHVTVFTSDDKEPTFKFGKHDAKAYMNDDNKLRMEEAEVFELKEPVSREEFEKAVLPEEAIELLT